MKTGWERRRTEDHKQSSKDYERRGEHAEIAGVAILTYCEEVLSPGLPNGALARDKPPVTDKLLDDDW